MRTFLVQKMGVFLKLLEFVFEMEKVLSGNTFAK